MLKPPGAKAIFLRKQAALIYVMTTLSMRRWIDICRLKWTDIKWVKKPHGNFLLIRIHISKSNNGEKIEEVTLAEQPNSWACPVKLMVKFWRMQNEPRKGFIFPCHNLIEGDQCAGHRGQMCLGYENGESTIRLINRIGAQFNWKTIPARHTGRRTGIAVCSLFEIPRQRILEAAGWTNNTDMLRHYTAATQAVREDGIANLYAKELQKEKPFKQFDQINEITASRGRKRKI